MLRRKRPSKPNNLLQDSARASGWPEAPDRLNPENVGYMTVASVSRRMKMDSRPVFLESALLLPLREPATEETQWSPAVFAAIEWRRFEAVCALLFSQGSFTLQSESYGPGLGLLIRLYSQTGGRPVAIVHCRHWQDKRVEEPELREFLTVMASHKVKRGTYVTATTYTPEARQFAKDNHINAMDSDALLALIAKRKPSQQLELLAEAYEGEYWVPTCANCGTKMVKRALATDRVPFWGCVSFPQCTATLRMLGYPPAPNIENTSP